MIKTIIIVVSSFILCACDPVYLAEIINNNTEDVFIKVGFNKEELEKSWGIDKSYIEFLKSYPNWTDISSAVDFDTINLINTYKIEAGQSFPLSSGIGGYPDLRLIKFLLILDEDSTMFENQEQLINAFEIKDGRHWILELE